MGRAERRKAGRGTITITEREFQKQIDKAVNDASVFTVESLMTCFSKILHEDFGFGYTRINRAITAVDNEFGMILSGDSDIEELKKELFDKTGINIYYSGGEEDGNR